MLAFLEFAVNDKIFVKPPLPKKSDDLDTQIEKLKARMMHYKDLDYYSRRLFPLVFIIFNIVYFKYYLDYQKMARNLELTEECSLDGH